MSDIVYIEVKSYILPDKIPMGYVKLYLQYFGIVLYYKDGKRHHETTSSYNKIDSYKSTYHLNDECLGNETHFNDETWAKFAAKYMKLRMFK